MYIVSLNALFLKLQILCSIFVLRGKRKHAFYMREKSIIRNYQTNYRNMQKLFLWTRYKLWNWILAHLATKRKDKTKICYFCNFSSLTITNGTASSCVIWNGKLTDCSSLIFCSILIWHIWKQYKYILF